MRPERRLPLALLLLFSTATLAGELQFNAELGYQSTVTIQDKDLAKSLLYAEPSFKYSFELASSKGFKTGIDDPPSPTLLELNAGVRAWFDPQAVRPLAERGFSFNKSFRYWAYELGVRSLNLSASRDNWRLVAGLQEVPWGETFGLPILELVNPRDYRDPLLFDPSWVRLPVAALQGQLFLDKLTLQGVLSPVPRHDLYPASDSRFDPTVDRVGITLQNHVASPDPGFGKFVEFGGRASYLFDGGLDVGLIYYHHWNRMPIYELEPSSPTSGALVPIEDPVDTIGNTLSYSAGPLVLRADTAFHWNHPLQLDSSGKVEHGDKLFQTAIGADLTSQSGWLFGLQGQAEADFLSTGARSLQWLSSRISKKFFHDSLEPELYVFSGLGNPDLWFQPKLSWYFGGRYTLSLRADLIGKSDDPGEGYLWTVHGQSRLFLWFSAKI